MLVRGSLITMMQWVWTIYLIVMSCDAINRPVYKIQLTQKGYAQFLQYDVEIPPLREFTFCTWLNFYGFETDQTIFTYLLSSDIRPIRLSLDAGGNNVKLSILDKVFTIIPLQVTVNTWHNLCLSYQSDFGAWAFYVDERLVSCEASQAVFGYVIPGGGSVIIGYGIGDNGMSNGLEGEIYGVNMILKSTIERNHTLENDPLYRQKDFRKNTLRITGVNNVRYVSLDDLDNSEVVRPPKRPKFAHGFKKTYNDFSSFNTVNDQIIQNSTLKPHFTIDTDPQSAEMFHSLEDNFPKISTAGFSRPVTRYQKREESNEKLEFQSMSGQPRLSLFETPPPPITRDFSPKPKNFFMGSLHSQKPVSMGTTPIGAYNMQESSEIYDIETPPSPINNDAKVYGQWTSSKFAGAVLNYLKSAKFQNKTPPKIPPTIPLQKVSESYPYSPSFRSSKIVTPLKINKPSYDLSRRMIKRETQKQNINVEIVSTEASVRDHILKSHAKTVANNVEITIRGEPKNYTLNSSMDANKKKSFSKTNDPQSSSEQSVESIKNLAFVTKKPILIKKDQTNRITSQKKITATERDKLFNNLISNLPFLKSLEYFLEDTEKSESTTSSTNDIFAKKNLWHNIKSYNSDYTPREINAKGLDSLNHVDKISDINKVYPTVRLNYRHNKNFEYTKPNKENNEIEKARDLANRVSFQANQNIDSVSILKYNHGFLPGHKQSKLSKFTSEPAKPAPIERNFNRPVKIGNALNEHHIVGRNDEEKKRSFIGGNDKIPDINRYRSDIDNSKSQPLPPSLVPKVCYNVELYDRVLYVKPDGSIDMTNILSPLKNRNIAIEFIIVNYKKCSLRDSPLENNNLLLIDYSKTPVRLFGGALPKKTKDLCGFF